MRPGWARTCTCEGTPLGYFCDTCHAFAGAMPDSTAPHSRPRPALERPASLPEPRTDVRSTREFRGGTLRH